MTPTSPASNFPLAEETYPFWGWQDLALFLGAAAPAVLGSSLLVILVRRLAGQGLWNKALEVLLVQFLAYGFWFLALYAIFHFRHSRPFWDSLAWSGSTHDIAASLMVGPLLALVVAVSAAFLATPKVDTPLQELLNDRVSVFLVGVFATTLGPLCEELSFRGFLMPLVARAAGPVLGIVLAAAPFAILHGPQYGWSWRHLLLVGLAGVAFGWTRYRTGSTAAATAMHATYNLTFFAGFLLFEGDTLRPW